MSKRKTVQLTERQRRIADLYNCGFRRTQSKVAEELGISRATVARELQHMRDMKELEDAEPDVFRKVWHEPKLTPQAEDDYRPLDGEPIISKSTAYRRTAKALNIAPEQIDKAWHELKIARRAINRALAAIQANDGRVILEAAEEVHKIVALIMLITDPSHKKTPIERTSTL